MREITIKERLILISKLDEKIKIDDEKVQIIKKELDELLLERRNLVDSEDFQKHLNCHKP